MKGLSGKTLLLLALIAAPAATAQTIYKSVNPDGTVVYTDKPPADGSTATAIQQKPSKSPASSTHAQSAGSSNPGKNHYVPVHENAARAAEIQRSAYGTGIPQPAHMAVQVTGPVDVETAADGTKTYRSDGHVIMSEHNLKPGAVFDDHVSPVSNCAAS